MGSLKAQLETNAKLLKLEDKIDALEVKLQFIINLLDLDESEEVDERKEQKRKR